jgi:hypothetical protein
MYEVSLDLQPLAVHYQCFDLPTVLSRLPELPTSTWLIHICYNEKDRNHSYTATTVVFDRTTLGGDWIGRLRNTRIARARACQEVSASDHFRPSFVPSSARFFSPFPT